MKITAIFESWHIPDGNYPPLKKGQLVNLSFQVEPRKFVEVSPQNESMVSLGLGEYSFIAKIIRQYPEGDSTVLTVFETGNFRFYAENEKLEKYPVGSYLNIEGPVLLDYYVWVEFPHSYKNPPDLFYNLKVEKIVKAMIPERYIIRHKTGWLRYSPDLRPPDSLRPMALSFKNGDKKPCPVNVMTPPSKRRWLPKPSKALRV